MRNGVRGRTTGVGQRGWMGHSLSVGRPDLEATPPPGPLKIGQARLSLWQRADRPGRRHPGGEALPRLLEARGGRPANRERPQHWQSLGSGRQRVLRSRLIRPSSTPFVARLIATDILSSLIPNRCSTHSAGKTDNHDHRAGDPEPSVERFVEPSVNPARLAPWSDQPRQREGHPVAQQLCSTRLGRSVRRHDRGTYA